MKNNDVIYFPVKSWFNSCERFLCCVIDFMRCTSRRAAFIQTKKYEMIDWRGGEAWASESIKPYNKSANTSIKSVWLKA